MIDIFIGLTCIFKAPDNNFNTTLKIVEDTLKDILKLDVHPQFGKGSYSKELGIGENEYYIEFYTNNASKEVVKSWDDTFIKKLGLRIKEIIGGGKVVIYKQEGFDFTIEPLISEVHN